MRVVYADAAYYVALLARRDRLHVQATAIDQTDASLRFVTCDAIFLELLAYTSGKGAASRRLGVALVDAVRADERVTIVYQNPALFDEALALYRKRPDKGYSLVDCLSMVICRDRGIAEVLTHDHHFAQEGLTILL